jgi:hypothetical protein
LINLFQVGDPDAVREQAVVYLTHLARAELLEKGIYPASKPELPDRHRSVGNQQLAERLDRVLNERSAASMQMDEFLKPAI